MRSTFSIPTPGFLGQRDVVDGQIPITLTNDSVKTIASPSSAVYSGRFSVPQSTCFLDQTPCSTSIPRDCNCRGHVPLYLRRPSKQLVPVHGAWHSVNPSETDSQVGVKDEPSLSQSHLTPYCWLGVAGMPPLCECVLHHQIAAIAAVSRVKTWNGHVWRRCVYLVSVTFRWRLCIHVNA